MINQLLLCLFLTASATASALTISKETADAIALKIWKNECACSVEGLTCWNKGENFGSFGIGHFIWYPAGRKESFQETFPELLTFLEKQGVILPYWLAAHPCCPWNSRDEFYQEIGSTKMIELRTLLYDTRDLQAIFIAERMDNLLPSIIKELPETKKKAVSVVFKRLEDDPRGIYALIDYINFKGVGLSQKETYNGRGWGLLQVLERVSPLSKDLLKDFVTAAKQVLQERVDNSPPERNEKRWLAGWHNRIDTYL